MRWLCLILLCAGWLLAGCRPVSSPAPATPAAASWAAVLRQALPAAPTRSSSPRPTAVSRDLGGAAGGGGLRPVATATFAALPTLTSVLAAAVAMPVPAEIEAAPVAPTDVPTAITVTTESATPVAAPAGLPVTAIAAATPGGEFTVAGQVTAAYSFAAGFKLTLADDSGAITLLLWHDVYDDLWDAPQLQVGARVRATGLVGEYEGERQLVPDWGGAVQVLAPAPPAALVPLGALAERVDQYVTVRGVVTAAAAFDYGWQITLSDDSGEITLFLWANVAARVANGTALLQTGATVRVSGWVQVYRGNRQLVPALPYAVVVES